MKLSRSRMSFGKWPIINSKRNPQIFQLNWVNLTLEMVYKIYWSKYRKQMWRMKMTKNLTHCLLLPLWVSKNKIQKIWKEAISSERNYLHQKQLIKNEPQQRATKEHFLSVGQALLECPFEILFLRFAP